MQELPPEMMKAVPGAAGSLVSLLFMKEAWPRRVAMFLAGSALSYYGTPWVRRLVDLDAGFAGFLLGMLGMIVVSGLVKAWEGIGLTEMLRDLVRQLLRLPPVQPQPPKEQ